MGPFPNIFGAYSTDQLPNLIVGRDVAEADIMNDIRAWAEYFNRAVELFEGTFAQRTTEPQGTFGSGDVGGEMQPYTEYGETEATRTAEAQWQWGASIYRFRDRQLYTEEYLKTSNLDQLNKDLVAATNRNYTTRLKMVIKAVVTNTNYVFNDTKQFPGLGLGNIQVYRLFNADSRPGRMTVNGAVVQVGTLTSFVPSGNATINAAHFTLARTKLKERGYLGRVVHLISPADVDTVKAITGFIPIAQPTPYIDVENNNSPVTTAVVTAPEAIGVISNGLGDGEVIVYPFWPAGYTFSYDKTQPKPVVIREHPVAEFRGFRLIQDQTRTAYGDGALRNKRWEYIAGEGIMNQANGVVVQATTGAYAVPVV
jgi:hypothetical protein